MDNRITLPEFKAEIDGDKAYPIFTFKVYFKYDGVDNDSTIWHQMYKELPSQDILLRDFNTHWGMMLNDARFQRDYMPRIVKHPIILNQQIYLDEYETWCLLWFNHYTYVDGRNDEDLTASFYRFILRKLPLHRQEKYCLMGAEDSWRIKPPCHCDDCQRQGMTYIDH